MDLPPHSHDPAFLAQYSGTKLLTVAVAFCPVVTLVVALRWYAQKQQTTAKGADDYLIYPALFFTLLNNTLCAVAVSHGGAGRHMDYWDINDPARIRTYAIILYALELTYILTCALNKIIILAIYLRIFQSKVQRWTCYAIGIILVLSWIAYSVAATLQCLPFSSMWLKLQPGRCIDLVAYYRYLSVPNIITDVAILVLPLPMIWGLHLNVWQKLALAGVFLTGSIGLVASLLRFAYFMEGQPLADPTWSCVDLLCWTVVEPCVYLMAGCLPRMRPLFKSLLDGANTIVARTYAPRSGADQSHRASRYCANTEGLPRLPSEDKNFELSSIEDGDGLIGKAMPTGVADVERGKV